MWVMVTNACHPVWNKSSPVQHTDSFFCPRTCEALIAIHHFATETCSTRWVVFDAGCWLFEEEESEQCSQISFSGWGSAARWAGPGSLTFNSFPSRPVLRLSRQTYQRQWHRGVLSAAGCLCTFQSWFVTHRNETGLERSERWLSLLITLFVYLKEGKDLVPMCDDWLKTKSWCGAMLHQGMLQGVLQRRLTCEL